MKTLEPSCFTSSRSLPDPNIVQIAMILTLVHCVVCQVVTQIKVGVLLIADVNAPYSIQRAGPAVDIAMESVNTRMLNGSYRLVKVLRVYDDICDARFAAGKP